MGHISIKKIIAHDMDLTQQHPSFASSVVSILETPKEVLDFFVEHIISSNTAKQVRACKFRVDNGFVIARINQMASDLKNSSIFVQKSIEFTEELFHIMQGTTSKSSGVLIFIHYFDGHLNNDFLAILKMDPNPGIQIDRKKNVFVIHQNMLPSANERLHKSAFIKLVPNLFDEEFQLRVLDKQQAADNISKFFVHTFLEAYAVTDDRRMTELVNETLTNFAEGEELITMNQRTEFIAAVDEMLKKGNNVNLDEDIQSLILRYDTNDQRRETFVQKYKEYLLEKREDAYFEFKADKRPTHTLLLNKEEGISFQYPSMLHKKIRYNFDEERDVAIIEIDGIRLSIKSK